MPERIADYCDAILVIDSLCKSGHKCCVTRDAFGDSPPAELLVIDRTNASRNNTSNKNGMPSQTSTRPGIHSTNPSMATTTTTSTAWTSTKQPSTAIATTTSTTTMQTRPKPTLRKPCKGECTSGLYALFCDNIDTEADCPGDGSCCITELPVKEVHKFIRVLFVIRFRWETSFIQDPCSGSNDDRPSNYKAFAPST